MPVPVQDLGAERLAALPPKVRAALNAVLQAAAEGFTGSLELHFKDGNPIHRVRHDTERF